MNKAYSYEQGFQTGYEIATENRSDYSLADEDEREEFVTDMLEHESDIFRQYSPFEFFACEINKCGNRAEELWDSYDKGVFDGVMKLVTEEVNLIKNNHG